MTAPPTTPVTTWYLEMRDPAHLRPAPVPVRPCAVDTVTRPSPAFLRFLYTAVGGDWWWTDRLPWTWDDWSRHLANEVRVQVLRVDGQPAGYIELKRVAGEVEIAYFGLLPEWTGQGLGGHLLSQGLRAAWAWDASRVWVHTCSLDGPAALANYRARGLRDYHVEVHQKPLPPRPGPWPGAASPYTPHD